MNDKDRIRKSVSHAYAEALSASTSCCGGGSKGAVVELAGYTAQELASLPSEAAVNSFGCGNPLAMSEVSEGDVVLDLGCGAGIDVLIAAERVGPRGRVIGVDMTEAMITQARQALAVAGCSNAEIREGLIEALPVEDATVDWVISNCVINLSPDKPAVFSELARVLKPGGRMLVADILARDLPPAVVADLTLYHSCIAGAISEDAYCEALSHAGLVDIAVRERLYYDDVQLGGLLQSDLPPAACDAASTEATAPMDGLAKTLCGKVCSAKIYARKPDAQR